MQSRYSPEDRQPFPTASCLLHQFKAHTGSTIVHLPEHLSALQWILPASWCDCASINGHIFDAAQTLNLLRRTVLWADVQAWPSTAHYCLDNLLQYLSSPPDPGGIS